MKDLRQELGEYLQADSTLLALLASNKPWNNENGTANKQNSIITADKAPLPNTPYLTIRYLADSQVGTNLKDAFFVVRCYNHSDKTFVEIDEVLSRVQALLHRHRFDYSGKACIDTAYELTSDELQDEAFKQNFRQSQFRVLYL